MSLWIQKQFAYIKPFRVLYRSSHKKEKEKNSLNSSQKDKSYDASTLKMATFSYFQNYPHSLLDTLHFPTTNSSIKLSGFIDQNPLHSLPNTSTIEDTSLNPFLDLYTVDKTENSDVKKQSNTNTTGSSSGDQLSRGPFNASAGNKRQKKTRNGSTSKVSL